MIKNALILAAGKGSRMWPLSESIPKPLLPLGGLPIIERQIQELISVGVKELYILIEIIQLEYFGHYIMQCK